MPWQYCAQVGHMTENTNHSPEEKQNKTKKNCPTHVESEYVLQKLKQSKQ